MIIGIIMFLCCCAVVFFGMQDSDAPVLYFNVNEVETHSTAEAVAAPMSIKVGGSAIKQGHESKSKTTADDDLADLDPVSTGQDLYDEFRGR